MTQLENMESTAIVNAETAEANLLRVGQVVGHLNKSAEKQGNLTNLAGRDRLAEMLSVLTIPCKNSRARMFNGSPVMTGDAWLVLRLTALLDEVQYKRNGVELDATMATLRRLFREYPVWAIERMLDYWAGADNPDSGWIKSGKMEARLRVEMQEVNAAQSKIMAFDKVLRESGLESVARDIKDGRFPLLVDFDRLLLDKGVDIRNAAPQRGGVFHTGKHAGWLAKFMRDAIIANDPKQARAVDGNTGGFDVDKEIAGLVARAESSKRGGGFKPIGEAGAAKAFMDKAGGVQK